MGVVISRWVWLDPICVVSGCFPHITYISLLHLYLLFFAAVYIYTRAMYQPTRLSGARLGSPQLYHIGEPSLIPKLLLPCVYNTMIIQFYY